MDGLLDRKALPAGEAGVDASGALLKREEPVVGSSGIAEHVS